MPDYGSNRVPISLERVIPFHLLALGCRIVRILNRIGSAKAQPSNSAILVEPYGMGDIVSIQPLAVELQHAGWDVVVCGQARWRLIMDGTGWINIPATWQSMGQVGFLRFLRRNVASLRKKYRGAVGVDPRGDIRSILFLHLIGCKRVLSVDHYLGTTVRVPASVAELIPDTSACKMRWEIAQDFANAMGITESASRPPRIEHLGKDAVSKAGRIGLITVAPWDGKLWPPDNWRSVVRKLRERNLDPVLICGPGQEGTAQEAAGTTEITVLMAEDVPNLARIIASCEAIITLDTGPMHLASAMEKPVIALFGTGQLPLWAPRGKHARTVISPLFKEGQIRQMDDTVDMGKKYMGMIAVEAVMAAFWETYSESLFLKRPQQGVFSASDH